MTLVDVPQFWLPRSALDQNANTLGGTSGLLLDAADEKAALIFQPPKAGDIRKVHFRTGTVTTGATLDVRLETVSSNVPTGTLWGTNTNVSHVVADTDDDAWLTTAALTADATVTQTDLDNGTWMALVFVNPSGSPGTLYIARTPWTTANGNNQMGAYAAHYTSSWSTSSVLGKLNIVLEYSDGSIVRVPGVHPVHAIGNTTIDTATNPDEVALRHLQSGKMRACGWWAVGYAGALRTCRVQVYESGNNTPLASAVYDDTKMNSGGATITFYGKFPAPVTLEHNTVYRLAFLPTTSDNLLVRYVDQASADIWDACEGDQDMIYSERDRSGTTEPDSASWSDTTTRRLMAGYIIDQVDDGASGGGTIIIPKRRILR